MKPNDRENAAVVLQDRVLYMCSITATVLLLLQNRVVYLCSITATVLLVQRQMKVCSEGEEGQTDRGRRHWDRAEECLFSKFSLCSRSQLHSVSVSGSLFLSLFLCLFLSVSQSLRMGWCRCGSLILVFLLQINCLHSVYITDNTGETHWYCNTTINTVSTTTATVWTTATVRHITVAVLLLLMQVLLSVLL